MTTCPVVTKRCADCGADKPLDVDHFPFRRSEKRDRSYFMQRCRPCHAQRQKAWQASHPDYTNARHGKRRRVLDAALALLVRVQEAVPDLADEITAVLKSVPRKYQRAPLPTIAAPRVKKPAKVKAPRVVLDPHDPAAHNLFEANQNLVRMVAHGMHAQFFAKCTGLEVDDLLQHALAGLWHASQRFDVARGIKFPTYASWCIRGHILAGMAKFRYGGKKARAKSFDFRHLTATGAPDDRPSDVDMAMGREDVIEEVERNETAEAVRHAIESMPRKSWRTVIRMRMADKTLDEVGRALGVSAERARQIEAKAMDMLKWLLQNVAAA